MTKPYLVYCKRDMQTETRKEYGETMLYQASKSFSDLDDARKYALSNLPAMLIKTLPVTDEEEKRIRDTNKPYAVGAEFFHTYCSFGDTEFASNFNVLRCDEQSLERVVERFAKEDGKNITVGIELKIF